MAGVRDMSDMGLGAAKPDAKDVKLMARWLWDVKSSGHSIDMYEPGRYLAHVPQHERKHGLVFMCYQRLLKVKSLMDFDDILVLVSSAASITCMQDCSHTSMYSQSTILTIRLPVITTRGALPKLTPGCMH